MEGNQVCPLEILLDRCPLLFNLLHLMVINKSEYRDLFLYSDQSWYTHYGNLARKCTELCMGLLHWWFQSGVSTWEKKLLNVSLLISQIMYCSLFGDLN